MDRFLGLANVAGLSAQRRGGHAQPVRHARLAMPYRVFTVTRTAFEVTGR